MALKRYGRAAVALFFAVLIGIGLLTLCDYTGSYDEYVLWHTIRVNLHEYALLFEKAGIRWETGLALDVEPIAQHSDRDHGMAPFLLCAPFLKQMDASTGFSSTLWCLITLCWFLAGVWALYAIARQIGLSRMLSCVAALVFYLSPRMFSEGHFSDRDVVLLCIVLLCLWQGIRFLKVMRLGTGVVFSFFGALAASVRLPGVIAWGLIGLAAVVQVTLRREWNRQKTLVAVATILGFIAFYVALTPATWCGAVSYFGYLFSGFVEYGWRDNFYFRSALFQMSKDTLPWYYILYLLLTTVPLYTFVLCAAGQLKMLYVACKRPKAFFTSPKGMLLAVSTCVWILPILSFAILRPVVYNGWRHFYFLYAGVLVLAGYGAEVLWQLCNKKLWMKRLYVAILCLCLGTTAIGLVMNHPNQSSYYNVLASKQTMETDYWNSAGTGALKRLLACENRNKQLPLEVGCYFFDIQNARFKLSDEQKAVLTTTIKRDSPYLYYVENYVPLYEVPKPEGYHVLFTVESYGRLIGTMYEQD